MAVVAGDVADSLRLELIETHILARPGIAVDALHLSEGLVVLYGMQLVEQLRVADPLDAASTSNVSLVDAIGFVAQLRAAYDATVTDGIGVGDPALLQRLLAVVEGLGLSASLAGAASYHMTLVQGLRLTASLSNFFGADVVDWLNLNPSTFGQVLAYAALVDTVGVAAAVSPQLLINVELSEEIDITPAMAVRMLFSPSLIEGIGISAGMLEPNGALTTWVMNTRTGAVTEYTNYAFNSFAQLGNKYLGASEDGIFELLGDDDAGEDIIARIKSGYLQFGGTQLSRLKEAYIAATGEGAMILRILTKDGETYDYSVDTRDGRSTKVNMGKGQRSRYFAFELISAGQDFDLDTLEFVPIVVQRRV
jgi:hypothetical protein